MNRNTLLIFGGMAALAITYGARFVNKLTYSVLETNFHKFSLTEIIIKSRIKLINKSSVPLDIIGFKGSIYYKGMEMSKIDSFDKAFTVPAKGNTDFTLYFGVNPAQFFQQLSVLINQPIDDIEVRGYLKTNKAKIPVLFYPDLLPA